LPRLLTIRTDLSEYKAPQFGYDRRGAGPRNTNASGQPYELKNIPSRTFTEADFGTTYQQPFDDFLLRGGQLLPTTTIRDIDRLTKMFQDTKSPNGLLFTAKQQVLSRTGVNVLATGNSRLFSKNRRAFNNGIYLPTSTLAQAGVNAIGGHLLKQGIDPTADTSQDGGGLSILGALGITDPLRNPTYFETVAFQERQNANNGGRVLSRLFQFYEDTIEKNTKANQELYNYSGGPGSDLGLSGKTVIQMRSDQRTGRNNATLSNIGFFDSINFGYFNYDVFKNPRTLNFEGAKYFNGSGVSNTYESFTGTDVLNGQFKTTNDDVSNGFISDVGQSVFQNGFQSNTPTVNGLGSTLDYTQLMDSKDQKNLAGGGETNNYPQTEILEDFRRKTNTPSVDSLAYSIPTNRYEQRTNLGTAGAKNQTTSYRTGNNESLDKINSLQIYKASNIDSEKEINDLCKFRIGVIDNDNPSLKTYIHFRAFLDDMSDNYSAEWEGQKYSGRAEKFYKYKGFDREFNLSWTVVAQSKQELIPMYQKLNYLASVCAPDYSADGYMRGNLIELTVGGYLFNQVGIMTGVNYTVPMESPWEIAIGDQKSIDTRAAFTERLQQSISSEFLEDVNFAPIQNDPSVKELPHMIKVSGFKFIPIQSFVPNVQKNIFTETNQTGPGTLGDLETFGPERYISLSNGFNTNY